MTVMQHLWKAWWRPCPTLQWRHNEHDGVSNHRRLYCLLNRLFRRTTKKTSMLRVTGLCEGNSPVTGEFPAQVRTSNAEKFPFDDVIKDQTLPAWVTPPSCPLLLRSMHEFCKMSSTSYCLNKSLASLKNTLWSVKSFDLSAQWRRMFSWHADNHFIFTWLSQFTKFDQTQSSSHK